MNCGEDSPHEPARFLLRLFIAGTSSRSQRTITNLRHITTTYLKNRVDFEVIDVYRHPELAEANQIIAAPTLLKLQPLPIRRIIGDLSDIARVLRGLGLPGLDGEEP